MAWSIIGYGPPVEALPYVPDFLIVRQDDSIRCILRSRPRLDAEEPIPGPYAAHDGCALFVDDMWVCVESPATINLFLASDEKDFRTKRAQELAASIPSMKGDPVRVLQASEAAARLQGFDLPGLARRLQMSRVSSEETLEQILLRVRSSAGV